MAIISLGGLGGINDSPSPLGGRVMVIPVSQFTTSGDLTGTSVVLPGTVGGGAGVNTIRDIIPGGANGTTTDQGESGGVIKQSGWVLCNNVTDKRLMPLSSIVGTINWTFRLTFSTSAWTGTLQVGFRVWQISADKATVTRVSLPGENANGWVYSSTTGLSATANTTVSKTVLNVGTVTFDPSTSLLWVEAVVKVITIGATSATVNFANTTQSIQVPTTFTYARTSTSSAPATTTGTRMVANGRTSASSAPVSATTAVRVANLQRAGVSSAPATTSATRKIVVARTSASSATASTTSTRRVANSRTSGSSAPVSGTSATRRAALNRVTSSTAGATTSATRRVLATRSGVSSAPATTSSTRRVSNTRTGATSAPATTSATRRVNLQRTGQTDLASGTTTIEVSKPLPMILVDDDVAVSIGGPLYTKV